MRSWWRNGDASAVFARCVAEAEPRQAVLAAPRVEPVPDRAPNDGPLVSCQLPHLAQVDPVLQEDVFKPVEVRTVLVEVCLGRSHTHSR